MSLSEKINLNIFDENGNRIDIDHFLIAIIIQLEKEKEWLLHNLAGVHCQALRIYNDKAIKERKELIIKDMQRALKEE